MRSHGDTCSNVVVAIACTMIGDDGWIAFGHSCRGCFACSVRLADADSELQACMVLADGISNRCKFDSFVCPSCRWRHCGFHMVSFVHEMRRDSVTMECVS